MELFSHNSGIVELRQVYSGDLRCGMLLGNCLSVGGMHHLRDQ